MMITTSSLSIIDDEYKWPNSGDNLPKLRKNAFNKNKQEQDEKGYYWCNMTPDIVCIHHQQ